MTQINSKKTEVPILPMFPTEHSFSLIKNDRHGRIELHIRGIIPSPQHISECLSELYQVAESYSVIALFINTPGGDVATLTELLAILEKFDYVITIGSGNVCSAGFILWCRGNMRVVQSHSSFMAHREAYGGYPLKTDQQLELANHTNEVYGSMVKEICSCVLTEAELEKSRYTEVFLTGTELLSRNVAIHWKDFVQRDNTPYEMNTTVIIQGQEYMMAADNVIIRSEEGDYMTPILDVIYQNPNPSLYKINQDDGFPLDMVDEYSYGEQLDLVTEAEVQ